MPLLYTQAPRKIPSFAMWPSGNRRRGRPEFRRLRRRGRPGMARRRARGSLWFSSWPELGWKWLWRAHSALQGGGDGRCGAHSSEGQARPKQQATLEVLCGRTKLLVVSGGAGVAWVAKLGERPLMATGDKARRGRAGVQACEDERAFCRRDGRLPSWPRLEQRGSARGAARVAAVAGARRRVESRSVDGYGRSRRHGYACAAASRSASLGYRTPILE
jgi:hypothetical protein